MSRPPHSLDVIRVVDPCPQSWDEMTGDARVRYCAGCRKHVHDLSAMTRTEAEKIVCESAGSLCVRFSRAPDGRVRTLDYQPPAAGRQGWRFWALVSTCAGSLAAAAGGYLFARERAVPPPVVGVMMVTPPRPPPPTSQTGEVPPVMGMVPAPPGMPAAAPPTGDLPPTPSAG